jgi:translation elongation factor EF-1beta
MAQAHVDYLNSTVRDELIKASVAMYKEQPENKHKFLAEYFAKLSAERETVVEEKKVEPKKAEKKKKKKFVKMALSDVVFDITPDTSVEYDWEQVQKDIADIFLEGVIWAGDFVLVPFVFGLQKLIVVSQIMDAKVPTTSVIVEAILSVNGVGGCEMVTIECAGADWSAGGHGRKGTTAPPKAKGGAAVAAPDAKASKKSKKKKGKKADDGPRLCTPEMIKKDADKIAVCTKESDYYVCSVPEMDGSAQTNVTVEQLTECIKQIRVKCPNVALMLVAGGSSNLTCVADVPADKQGKINATDWVAAVEEFSAVAQGDANTACAEFVCDPEKGEFPIKMKDTTSASAFAYLKKMKVLDDGEEEVFYAMPDDGEEGY